jgi:RNA polymerase sigma-70 factor (ECF subfamily)
MNEPSALRTNVSLLRRLGREDRDQTAWNAFIERYGPQIFAWCRRWGLQETDAEDVTQTVLLKLAEKLRGFEYDPARRFRSWLKTVAQHAWIDLLRDQQRTGRGAGDSAAIAQLHEVQAREDLESRLEAAYDMELLEEAMTRVRLRVEPHTWEAFRLTALEQVPVTEVTAKLGLPTAVVYKARSKVQKMLRDEMEAMDEAPV